MPILLLVASSPECGLFAILGTKLTFSLDGKAAILSVKMGSFSFLTLRLRWTSIEVLSHLENGVLLVEASSLSSHPKKKYLRFFESRDKYLHNNIEYAGKK